jgi:hypothetical protein
MLLISAEFCGRWGCTWQENILNIILASLDGKSALILLGMYIADANIYGSSNLADRLGNSL